MVHFINRTSLTTAKTIWANIKSKSALQKILRLYIKYKYFLYCKTKKKYIEF